MNALPSVVTHTYDPSPGPFLNLCHLDDGTAETILARLRAVYGRNRNPAYLTKRRATEAWLRRERTGKGIRGNLTRPIYFFLGDYDDGLDPARPAAIVLPLAAFPADTVTFTLQDSMESYALSRHNGHPAAQVHTLRDLLSVLASKSPDLLQPARAGAEMAPARTGFVEVQVWDDTPLRTHCPEFFVAGRRQAADLSVSNA